MKSTEKIWHDENSEPPKNYIWAKNGKLFKYINGQWKEISKNNSGCDCPGAMFVHGTISEMNDEIVFTQNNGEPSPVAAKSHIEKGGTLYIVADTPRGNLEIPFSGFSDNNEALAFYDPFHEENIYWRYVPDIDFVVNVDYDSPDATQNNWKFWFTHLDQSTVGDANVCQLLIHYTGSDESYLLIKEDNGAFTCKNHRCALTKRETLLEEYPALTIPEDVEYIIGYLVELS